MKRTETERLVIYGAVMLSLILSIISLCNSQPATNRLDYIGVIVGILSLLVTILIGWQLVNYFVVEKRMRGYAKNLIEKYRHSVNCYVIAYMQCKRTKATIPRWE